VNRRHAMRARTARSVYESHHGPNMTPMVDVVMVILVFFMASAAILGPEWFVRSSLPVRGPAQTAPSDSRVIQLQITFDAESIQSGMTLAVAGSSSPFPVQRIASDEDLGPALASLVTTLNADPSPSSITLVALITPAPHTRYERVVGAHEACLRAGITKVGTAPPGM
jgi:biopolymer transport protein ExbD